MNYEVRLTDTLQKSLKILKKKFPRIKEDLLPIVQSLEKEPFWGERIPGWKGEIWKIRVKSSDLQKGKSGGFRLIYRWKEKEKEVFLLTVYFKSDKPDISGAEIEDILKKLNNELEK
ncbi:MAG: type II toxin-antitoxin system RelE/ParE family toxin [Proteobacteria bacterium]|nr:type II toxin-antitoxin system RelE/ParE family toxin [Pseudomonadota bacterium]